MFLRSFRAPLTNRLFLRLCAVTAIRMNPDMGTVVKVRTFTVPPNSPAAHRGFSGWSASAALVLFRHY